MPGRVLTYADLVVRLGGYGLVGGQEAGGQSSRDCGRPSGGSKFGENMSDMIVDGTSADEERLTNLGVGVTGGKEGEHFSLSHGQRGGGA